ncbi:hypothetical protein [Ferruginibacter albus]|uniref:hypothetical protein n=1 Tax=Ferruginibacter albus TaxID=2875540 RepID=UPI001CC4A9F8|nr:hypothetical protein [Ferruginibacter albus]UAY51724.1 hypothetical protein K9M53_14150 [Ferruginibacter albus]
MKEKKFPKALFAVAALFFCNESKAQLSINGATLYIQAGATVSVQGNVTSNTDIQGDGKLLLNGTANQTVDLKGTAVNNLEINNATNATLASDIKVAKSLTFTNGKITLGNYNLTLADVATTSGQGASKFLETNGTGQVVQQLTSIVTKKEVPVGSGTIYRPAFVTTSAVNTNASVGIRNLATLDPNSPPHISDYVTAYWPVTKTNVTGTLTVTGQYDASDVTGTLGNLKGYYYNGTDWSSATTTINTGTKQITAPVATASGEITGMDGFVLLKAKAFLQGAYNTVSGVMTNTLRTLPSFPLSDPYRTAPYNTSFTHTANTGVETISSTVLATQSNVNDNIVDWIFLELRNTATSGNAVLQTRSALLQSDGDIVDIDGVSPVTFNNVPAGNYVVAVRHRNHLGLSINPATTSKALSETKSTATPLDFSSSASNLLGTAGTNYLTVSGVAILYAGNANGNTGVKYSGPSNDPAYILSTVLGGNASSSVSSYNVGDVNLNGSVRYSGPSNDASYILSTVLSSNASSSKTQVLPN